MISKLDLKELLPVWYVGITETDILMDVENDLFEQLKIQIQNVQDNQYISTADSETIAIYEELLGITAQQGDTLEIRRFRVLTRMTSQVPYTLGYFKELLSSFGDSADVTMFYNEYRLLVQTKFEKKGQVAELDYLFRSIVPANIFIDSQNIVSGETPGNVFLSVGMTVTEFITITSDFKETKTIEGPQKTAQAFAVTESVSISSDFNEFREINVTQKTAQVLSITERLELR